MKDSNLPRHASDPTRHAVHYSTPTGSVIRLILESELKDGDGVAAEAVAGRALCGAEALPAGTWPGRDDGAGGIGSICSYEPNQLLDMQTTTPLKGLAGGCHTSVYPVFLQFMVLHKAHWQSCISKDIWL